jgi:hypothetical protein
VKIKSSPKFTHPEEEIFPYKDRQTERDTEDRIAVKWDINDLNTETESAGYNCCILSLPRAKNMKQNKVGIFLTSWNMLQVELNFLTHLRTF